MPEIRPSSNARATGHRRNDANFVASREARIEAFAVANVLTVDEYIHEPAQLPGIVSQTFADPRMGCIKCIQHLPDARSGHDDLGVSAGKSA